MDDYISLKMDPEQMTPGVRDVTYYLDKMGNRISVQDTGNTKSYNPNNLNEYSEGDSNPVSNNDQHQIYSYGPVNHIVNYFYRNDEQLIEVQSGSNDYQMKYDALGRCVHRTINGVDKYYIYDGERPILEYDGGGNLVGRNVYGKGVDEILMRTDYTFNPVKTYYLQHDHEGSVIYLTDTTGALAERYRYDVFGAPTIYPAPTASPSPTPLQASAYSNRFLFTGREYAGAFNFYEYRARAYHPGLGRFTSEDPKLFEAGDYNLFRYCHNDPLDMTDPMGLLAGFERYQFVYDPNEKLDNTHDGYHVAGVPGTEEKPGGVHLEVDRTVQTVSHLASGASGATTHQTTASAVNDTPTIHEQINVRYAADAGPKTQTFTRYNEWTHSNDLIRAANSYRASAAAWAAKNNMSSSNTLGMLQNGAQFGHVRFPSADRFSHDAWGRSAMKWDNRIINVDKSWLAPNGARVWPHTPIDPESGNPLNYNE